MAKHWITWLNHNYLGDEERFMAKQWIMRRNQGTLAGNGYKTKQWITRIKQGTLGWR